MRFPASVATVAGDACGPASEFKLGAKVVGTNAPASHEEGSVEAQGDREFAGTASVAGVTEAARERGSVEAIRERDADEAV